MSLKLSAPVFNGLFHLSLFLLYSVSDVNSQNFRESYLGCYFDGNPSKRLLGRYQENIDKNSPKACIELCKSNGYAFAGMQYGVECFCGNKWPSIKERVDEEECSTTCPGNSDTKCGAGWRTSVYKTGLDGSSGNEVLNYIGCFADYESHDDRLFDKHYAYFNEGMTPHYCTGLCYGLGYLYAGLQYNVQCFCDNRHPPSERIKSDSECSLECPGDKSKKCGGHWRLSVYATTITDIPVLGRHIGCYVDDPGNRLLKGPLRGFRKANTPHLCANFCFSRNYQYAGLQYRFECFCGNDDLPDSVVADSECELDCPGDESMTCGGYLRMAIYQLDDTLSYRSPQYIGCFKDTEKHDKRLFQGYKQNFYTSLKVERCIELCRRNGFHYSALEYSNECFCDDKKPSYDLLVNDSECNLKCTGDNSQNCGGDWRLSVYSTGLKNPLRNHDRYYGCFKDRNAPHRLMPYALVTFENSLTPEVCVQYCFRKGYPYAGLQWSNQCFCGEGRPPADRKVDESECSAKCSGDNNKNCGGDWRLSVYRTGIPRLTTDELQPEKYFIGCYNSTKRVLREYKIDLDNNSPLRCIGICRAIDYTYAGLENGLECWCGYLAPPHPTKINDGECSKPCTGDSDAMCGGLNRIAVYAATTNGLPETMIPPNPHVTVNKTCEKSVTETNGVNVCKGETIFEESFKTLSIDKWQHSVKISDFPDFNFVYYTAEKRNSFTDNGILHIRPTLVPDDEVTTGSLQLTGCTGEIGSTECNIEATSFRILPPVVSAEISTKNTFNFRYGIIEISAKLPTGDWLIPELWLEPKSEVYGPNLLSGRIKIAMALGNQNLVTSDNKDISRSVLDSGVMVGHDGYSTGRYVTAYKPEGWHSDFHNYTLVWTPDDVTLIVDGEQQPSTLATSKNARLCSLLNLEELCSTVYAKGTKITPFDKEFYIKLGVTVGGMREFPDGCKSQGHVKPWKNNELKATLKFWQDKTRWSKTWISEDTDMQIDYVKVRALT